MRRKELLLGAALGGGLLLLAAWGGQPVGRPGQKPGYPGKPKNGKDGSWQWGDVDEDAIPVEEFDFSGNGIFISPDCNYVIEGNLFWLAEGQSGSAVEFPSVAETLGYSRENSIVGWLDYKILQEGETDPIRLAQEFITEVAPMCWDVDPEFWGDGMKNWWQNFVARVTDHVISWEGSIDFGG